MVYTQQANIWSFTRDGTEFAEEIRECSVRRILTDWHLPKIDLWAVFPTGRMATAKARQFASFVQTILAEGATGHSGRE